MKKIIGIFIILCIILTMTGCKSKEDIATEYVKNNEYKQAYDILYDLDEDHSRADDCLVRWCTYCIKQKVSDQQLYSIKFEKKENAEKIYKIILSYVDNIKLNKEQSEAILQAMNCIEDFYLNDETLTKFKEVLNANIAEDEKNITLQNYLNNNQYKEAYEYAYNLDEDHSQTDHCLYLWYKYCINNEKIDDDLKNIKLNNDIFWEVYKLLINDYLCLKGKPTSQQCDFAMSILDIIEQNIIEDEYDTKKEGINNIRISLNYIKEGKYIWNIPEQKYISYKEYYSTVHNYSEENMNGYNLGYYGKLTEEGLTVYKDSTDNIELQIVYFQNFDYNKYNGFRTPLKNGDNFFDGYWFYYLTNLTDINRININGEIEEILSNDILNGRTIHSTFILDNKILYTVVINEDDTLTVYRIYLPDKKIEQYELKDDKYRYGYIDTLIPEDSNHLNFVTINPECIKKVQEIKSDKDLVYSILNQSEDFNKNDSNIYEYDQLYEKYIGTICKYISQKYNISYYTYLSYNINTKEEIITPADDYVRRYY